MERVEMEHPGSKPGSASAAHTELCPFEFTARSIALFSFSVQVSTLHK